MFTILGREAVMELMKGTPTRPSANVGGVSAAHVGDVEEGYASEDERCVGFVPAASSLVVGEAES